MELVCPDLVNLQDSTSYSLHNSVCLSPTEFSFLLQHQKTDYQFKGNRVIIPHSVTSPDPVTLFISYLTGCNTCFLLHLISGCIQTALTPFILNLCANFTCSFPTTMSLDTHCVQVALHPLQLQVFPQIASRPLVIGNLPLGSAMCARALLCCKHFFFMVTCHTTLLSPMHSLHFPICSILCFSYSIPIKQEKKNSLPSLPFS